MDFFEDTLKETVDAMKERQYEPIGVSLNPPFPCMSIIYSVAFVLRIDDEVYWVHMPETYWFHLLANYYGRKSADEIIKELGCKKI